MEERSKFPFRRFTRRISVRVPPAIRVVDFPASHRLLLSLRDGVDAWLSLPPLGNNAARTLSARTFASGHLVSRSHLQAGKVHSCSLRGNVRDTSVEPVDESAGLADAS